MQHKKRWYPNFRFILFVVLCAVMLLGQGLFVRPALASPATRALASNASDKDMSYSVITRGAGKLDIFIVRNGGEIFLKSWTGSAWTGWSNLGRAPSNAFFYTVSAVAAGNNRWDIFARASDNLIWHLAFDGTFLWTWESMGNAGNGSGYGVQAVSTGNGRIDVFTRATCSSPGCGSALWKYWTASGGWKPSQTGWSTLDNTGADFSFTALAHSGNRIDLFRRSRDDNKIWRKVFNGSSWAPVNPFTQLPLNQWQNMNGEATQTPYAVSWGTNRIDVFVRGTDNNVHINSTDNAGANWTGWNVLGRGNTNPLVTSVSAVAWGSNRLDLFTSEGGTVYHKAWTGTSWWPSQTGGWEDIGLMLVDSFEHAPLPISWGPSRIDLFKYQSSAGSFEKTLYHKWTNGNGWGPSQTDWESLGP